MKCIWKAAWKYFRLRMSVNLIFCHDFYGEKMSSDKKVWLKVSKKILEPCVNTTKHFMTFSSWKSKFMWRDKFNSRWCKCAMPDWNLVNNTNLPLCASFLLRLFVLRLKSLPLRDFIAGEKKVVKKILKSRFLKNFLSWKSYSKVLENTLPALQIHST